MVLKELQTQKILNFSFKYEGALKEGIVELVDLSNFEILHTWNPDIDVFNDLVEQVDEFEYLKRDRNDNRNILIHPKLI